VADQRDAGSEEIGDRIAELERRVRRLQWTIIASAVLVASVLGIDRNWEKVASGIAAIGIVAFGFAVVPLIIIGGMKLLDRCFRAK